jgi:hypothetical protein
MNPAEIIEQATVEGVILALSPAGTITATGDRSAVDRSLPILRENKAVIVEELHRERRRAKVLTMLEPASGSKYAVFVADDTTDPVICTVAIRGVVSFEMAIPHHSYDGLVLLELLEKHSIETHAQPSQISGKADTSPSSHGGRLAHPGRRAVNTSTPTYEQIESTLRWWRTNIEKWWS